MLCASYGNLLGFDSQVGAEQAAEQAVCGHVSEAIALEGETCCVALLFSVEDRPKVVEAFLGRLKPEPPDVYLVRPEGGLADELRKTSRLS